MKEYLYCFLRFILCLVGIFVIVYIFNFFIGWRLFESGDFVLIEIGASALLGIVFFALNEVMLTQNQKIKKLEERVEKLENKRK